MGAKWDGGGWKKYQEIANLVFVLCNVNLMDILFIIHISNYIFRIQLLAQLSEPVMDAQAHLTSMM